MYIYIYIYVYVYVYIYIYIHILTEISENTVYEKRIREKH